MIYRNYGRNTWRKMMYDVSVFEDELSLIENEDLREVVREELEAAPAWFWTSPSSITGKHHPQWALGDGGLVRHTKCVVWLAAKFSETYDLKVDILVSAALLHDIYKYGGGSTIEKSDTNRKQYRVHGEVAAEVLSARTFDSKLLNRWWGMICNAVRKHMGKYSPNGYKLVKYSLVPSLSGLATMNDFVEPYALMISMADVVASRREFTYDPMVEE